MWRFVITDVLILKLSTSSQYVSPVPHGLRVYFQNTVGGEVQVARTSWRFVLKYFSDIQYMITSNKLMQTSSFHWRASACVSYVQSFASRPMHENSTSMSNCYFCVADSSWLVPPGRKLWSHEDIIKNIQYVFWNKNTARLSCAFLRGEFISSPPEANTPTHMHWVSVIHSHILSCVAADDSVQAADD